MAVTRDPYSDLLDEEIDADSPLTASVAKRWRDNWFASLCTADGGVLTPVGNNRTVFVPNRLQCDSGIFSERPLVSDGASGIKFGGEEIPVIDSSIGSSQVTVLTVPITDADTKFYDFQIHCFSESTGQGSGSATFRFKPTGANNFRLTGEGTFDGSSLIDTAVVSGLVGDISILLGNIKVEITTTDLIVTFDTGSGSTTASGININGIYH